jgi:hypothetical protein
VLPLDHDFHLIDEKALQRATAAELLILVNSLGVGLPPDGNTGKKALIEHLRRFDVDP